MADLEPAIALADRIADECYEPVDNWDSGDASSFDRDKTAKLIEADRAAVHEPLERRVRELEGKVRWFVEKAADEKLDGYRELGQRAADAENRLDDARRRIAELEAQIASAREEALRDAVNVLDRHVAAWNDLAARDDGFHKASLEATAGNAAHSRNLLKAWVDAGAKPLPPPAAQKEPL